MKKCGCAVTASTSDLENWLLWLALLQEGLDRASQEALCCSSAPRKREFQKSLGDERTLGTQGRSVSSERDNCAGTTGPSQYSNHLLQRNKSHQGIQARKVKLNFIFFLKYFMCISVLFSCICTCIHICTMCMSGSPGG